MSFNIVDGTGGTLDKNNVQSNEAISFGIYQLWKGQDGTRVLGYKTCLDTKPV